MCMAQPDLRDVSTDHRNKGKVKPDQVKHTQDEERQYRQSSLNGALWATHRGHRKDAAIAPDPDRQ